MMADVETHLAKTYLYIVRKIVLQYETRDLICHPCAIKSSLIHLCLKDSAVVVALSVRLPPVCVVTCYGLKKE